MRDVISWLRTRYDLFSIGTYLSILLLYGLVGLVFCLWFLR